MGELFEPAPKVKPEVDEDGYVKLRQEELDRILSWMERFRQFVYDNFD